MAQITESLIAEFESRLESNLHINSTMGEERQLIEAWKAWNRRAEAVPEGYKLLKDTTEDERSWVEDREHENGNYYNLCGHCGRQFIGHKRRVVCKSCATLVPEVKHAE